MPEVRKEEWNAMWHEFRDFNFWGKIYAKNQERNIKMVLDKINLVKSSNIIDIGCGTGRTLKYFKDFGYKKAIGIDLSDMAIKHCENKGLRLGKDVFKKDAKRTGFKTGSFDLVFSDGLLEHFSDFTPIVKEMTRISNRYVLITQPNHFSLLDRLRQNLKRKDVHEYTYKLKDFVDTFEKFGYFLKYKKSIGLFFEYWILLFEKS